MSTDKFDSFWEQVHKQKYLKKKPMDWLQLAMLIGDYSFLQAKEAESKQPEFENWWQCCFELLAPLQVRISNVHYMGSDHVPEHIEVVNDGPASIDVSGWTISAGDEKQEFVFPDLFVLQPGQAFKIYTGVSEGLSFGFKKKQIWNNKGDTGILFNPQRKAISTWSYGTAAHQFIDISHIEYDGKESRTEADEYVKVTNNNHHWLDVSGWTLKSNKNQTFTFPENSYIPPYNNIRVYTNQIHTESGGYSFGHPTAIWNNKGDKAVLSDANGKQVSEYEY